jgi:hypothetical protein
MKLRKLLMIPAMVVLGAMAMPAAADVRVDVNIGAHSPPSHRWVAPRRNDLAWVPGYWSFHHGHRVWHEGYWVEVRQYRPHYVERGHHSPRFAARDEHRGPVHRVGPYSRDRWLGLRDRDDRYGR